MENMNANQRGCVYLLGALVFAIIFCVGIPFILLPAAGTAVTLPAITVPGEPYLEGWPSEDFQIVNTLGGMLLADVIVLLIAFRARGASKNWTKQVPGRFQGAVEVLVQGFWGLTKAQAGSSPRVRNLLFPLVASIFVFLLAGNWGKLLPGVESVGLMHCAIYEPVTLNGHPIHETNFLGLPYFVQRVEGPLQVGTLSSPEAYYQCKSFKPEFAPYEPYRNYIVTEIDPYEDARIEHLTRPGDTLASIVAQYEADAAAITLADLSKDDKYPQYTGVAELDLSLDAVVARYTDAEGHLTLNTLGEPHGDSVAEYELEPNQTVLLREELIGVEATTKNNQLYSVVPFFRGVATDLNLTIGLALLAFVMIQYFGVAELGLNYFQKFINVNAIGNVAKRPLGIIDFVAGLFEIVSELGKIISLSFRLFGAIFAGTVLYAVILFLVGAVTPVVILLLEVIVGGAQAAVFAVLTLIFSAQAMVSHHHDDDHDEHGDGHH